MTNIVNRNGYCYLIAPDKNLVVVQYREWLSSKLTRPFLDEVAKSGYQPGMDWLVDMRLSDFTGYDHDSIYQTMLKRDQISHKVPHKLAFLGVELNYGHLRQITQEANVYVGGCQAKEFTDLDEALQWLGVTIDVDLVKALKRGFLCAPHDVEIKSACNAEPLPAASKADGQPLP